MTFPSNIQPDYLCSNLLVLPITPPSTAVRSLTPSSWWFSCRFLRAAVWCPSDSKLNEPWSLRQQDRTVLQPWTPQCTHMASLQFVDVFPILRVPQQNKLHSSCLLSAEQRGITTSLEILAMLLLIQSRTSWAFAGARATDDLMSSSLLLTADPRHSPQSCCQHGLLHRSN